MTCIPKLSFVIITNPKINISLFNKDLNTGTVYLQVWLPGSLTALSFLHLLHLSGGSLGPSQLATSPQQAATPSQAATPTTPVPPDWGPWSPWSACSRSCDSGLQRRERVCLNATGGCEGGPLGWRMCSLHPCPSSTPSWHQEQCSRLGFFLSSL